MGGAPGGEGDVPPAPAEDAKPSGGAKPKTAPGKKK
jgi:hypothetical protein